jgi:hypothetical protein
MAAAQTSNAGMLDKLKDTLNPTNIIQKYNLTQEKLIELLLYFGTGFVVGYILKKYSKIFDILVAGLLLLVLEQ